MYWNKLYNITTANLMAKKCKHKNKVLRVIETVVTCETTATFYQDCGKQLTEPKTDC